MSSFEWYSGSSQTSNQPSFNPQSYDSTSLPPQEYSSFSRQPEFPSQGYSSSLPSQGYSSDSYSQSLPQTYDRTSSPQHVENLVIPPGDHGAPIYINANNVYVQEDGHMTGTTAHTDVAPSTSTATTSLPHGSNPNLDVLAPGYAEKSTTTTTTHPSGASTTTHQTSSNANPLGVPAPGAVRHDEAHHPATETSDKHDTIPPLSTNDAHSSTLPKNSGVAPGSVNSAPAPLATTTTQSTAVGPSGPTTTTTSTTAPNAAPGLAGSANLHEPVGTKPKKEHKSFKARLHDWKARRHGVNNANGDVHPKDSRDGKVLPSQNELSQKVVTEPHGNDANAPVLHKDAHDATGKSITGSDANPSKASMPFKVPQPNMVQAPVEAKAQ